MKKTALENKITELAKARLNKEFNEAKESLDNNIFLKNLKIGDNHFFIKSHPSASIFFDKEKCNLEEIKTKLLAKFEVEELNKILESLREKTPFENMAEAIRKGAERVEKQHNDKYKKGGPVDHSCRPEPYEIHKVEIREDPRNGSIWSKLHIFSKK